LNRSIAAVVTATASSVKNPYPQAVSFVLRVVGVIVFTYVPLTDMLQALMQLKAAPAEGPPRVE
jgi:hypothetical protein